MVNMWLILSVSTGPFRQYTKLSKEVTSFQIKEFPGLFCLDYLFNICSKCSNLFVLLVPFFIHLQKNVTTTCLPMQTYVRVVSVTWLMGFKCPKTDTPFVQTDMIDSAYSYFHHIKESHVYCLIQEVVLSFGHINDIGTVMYEISPQCLIIIITPFNVIYLYEILQ